MNFSCETAHSKTVKHFNFSNLEHTELKLFKPY